MGKITIKEFFDNYKKGIKMAIHTPTKNDDLKLRTAFDKQGYKWDDGFGYLERSYPYYGTKTCYDNENSFSELKYYEEEIHIVLEMSDIDFEEETKEPILSVNDFAQSVYENAVAHGWWEKEPNFGDTCALINCEVAEAFEEYRNHKPMHYIENGKPEGIAIELCDVIIRCFDYLSAHNIDIEKLLVEKHEYNKTREYKHGGKRA